MEGSIRPCVMRFAEAMEERLRKHDKDRGADGWRADTLSSLLERIEEESDELSKAICEYNADKIRDECVDVGNFVMMISDITFQPIFKASLS